jgi:hypothetical protein
VKWSAADLIPDSVGEWRRYVQSAEPVSVKVPLASGTKRQS